MERAQAKALAVALIRDIRQQNDELQDSLKKYVADAQKKQMERTLQQLQDLVGFSLSQADVEEIVDKPIKIPLKVSPNDLLDGKSINARSSMRGMTPKALSIMNAASVNEASNKKGASEKSKNSEPAFEGLKRLDSERFRTHYRLTLQTDVPTRISDLDSNSRIAKKARKVSPEEEEETPPQTCKTFVGKIVDRCSCRQRKESHRQSDHRDNHWTGMIVPVPLPGEKEAWNNAYGHKVNGKVFLPNSKFTQYWELMMVLCIVYYAITAPLYYSFPMGDPPIVLEYALSVIFILDVLRNFVTAIEARGYLIYGYRLIAKHYLFGFFVLDLLTSVPFEFAFSQAKDHSWEHTFAIFFRMGKTLKMVRFGTCHWSL
jgi:hypothetical protein